MKCKYCNYDAKSNIGLGNHIASRHADLKQLEIERTELNYQFQCSWCNKKFETKQNISGHKAKCKEFQLAKLKFNNEVLTYDFLYDQFITQELSAYYVATKIINRPDLNISAGYLIIRAHELGIETRNRKEARKTKHSTDMRIATVLDIYGDTNVLGKKSSAYLKRNQTVKDKYGVDNVWQLDSVKQTITNTMMTRYGVPNAAYLANKELNSGRRSKIHIRIEEILSELNISFISEPTKMFIGFNAELQRNYGPRPDIVIESMKLIIEVNGDRWHANPNKYKATDIIPFTFNGNISAAAIWEIDRIKKEHYNSFGYNVIVLWEYDIRHNLEKIKEQLKELYENTAN